MNKRLLKKSKQKLANTELPTLDLGQIIEREEYYTRILKSKAYIQTVKRKKVEAKLNKLKKARKNAIKKTLQHS